MSRRGRKAALPGTGGATARGLLGDSRVVRCFVKDGSEYVDFDFDRLPVSPQMQRGLVVAFARLTAPGSRLTSIKSFQHLFRAINVFAEYLATLPDPPGSLADLMPEDIDGFVRNRRTAVKDVSNDLYLLKGLLRRGDGVSDAMVVKLRERSPSRIRGDGKTSYSRGEFKRIAAAARTELARSGRTDPPQQGHASAISGRRSDRHCPAPGVA